MKNKIIRNYIVRLLVFTGIYVITVLTVDKVFNGKLVDHLFRTLAPHVFWNLYGNRTWCLIVIYCFGVLFLSLLYVIRLGKVVKIASGSISEEEPFQTSYPEELTEFSQKLKEFKYELKLNEQARQMAEQQKNDLVVYLAHDLKTPLTSVIGYLTLLSENPELIAEQRAKYTGIALDKAYWLEHLINEFFDITRMNLQNIPTQRRRVNLTVMLMQLISEFYPMLDEKGITVKQEIEPELMLMADVDKLVRVFQNMFCNAVNYSYPNTEIVCSARKDIITLEENQAEAVNRVQDKDECVYIRIQNRGDQLGPEILEHIFDKFYRVDAARQSSTGGAGLGLAIAKQIIELHGGTINAVCNDGVMEFNIMLPIEAK